MPATAIVTKTRPQTIVETSQESEVVVDANLNRLIEKWDRTKASSDQSWVQIAKYVRDKQITATQLRYALVEIHGMSEKNAKSEVSKLMRFQKSPEASEMLDRKLAGDDDITVRDLQRASVKRGEKAEKDAEEVVEKRLKSTARYAILEAEMEAGEFVSLARSSFKSIQSAIESKIAATGTDGEGEGEEQDEGEEDEAES